MKTFKILGEEKSLHVSDRKYVEKKLFRHQVSVCSTHKIKMKYKSVDDEKHVQKKNLDSKVKHLQAISHQQFFI